MCLSLGRDTVFASKIVWIFIAYLDKFCKLTGSFAIVSTATQPALRLPDDNKEAKEFFLDYEQPFKLLSLSHYENPVFNRYTVEVQKSIIDIEQLGHQVLQEEESVLVILNTIQDTKDLYNFIRKIWMTQMCCFLIRILLQETEV